MNIIKIPKRIFDSINYEESGYDEEWFWIKNPYIVQEHYYGHQKDMLSIADALIKILGMFQNFNDIYPSDNLDVKIQIEFKPQDALAINESAWKATDISGKKYYIDVEA